MPNVMFRGGKVLFKNGKVLFGPDCGCCGGQSCPYCPDNPPRQFTATASGIVVPTGCLGPDDNGNYYKYVSGTWNGTFTLTRVVNDFETLGMCLWRSPQIVGRYDFHGTDPTCGVATDYYDQFYLEAHRATNRQWEIFYWSRSNSLGNGAFLVFHGVIQFAPECAISRTFTNSAVAGAPMASTGSGIMGGTHSGTLVMSPA